MRRRAGYEGRAPVAFCEGGYMEALKDILQDWGRELRRKSPLVILL